MGGGGGAGWQDKARSDIMDLPKHPDMRLKRKLE